MPEIIRFGENLAPKDEVTIPARRVSYDLSHLSVEHGVNVFLSLADDLMPRFTICNQWNHSYPGREIMPIFGRSIRGDQP